MKRLLLILFLLPLFFVSGAQTFRAGFYVGAASTDVSGTDNIDNDNDFIHLGFVAAATVSTKISSHVNFQMEIRYMQRGAAQNPVYDSATGTLNNYFRLNLNYGEVVLGVKLPIHFNVRNKSNDRYGILAGCSVGALVSSSYEVQSINFSIPTHSLDISPFVGLYYNITPHFYIEGRYSNSVTSALIHDVSKNPYFLYYNSFNAGHNLAFTLTLGFVFGGSSDQPSGPTPPPTNKPSDNE